MGNAKRINNVSLTLNLVLLGALSVLLLRPGGLVTASIEDYLSASERRELIAREWESLVAGASPGVNGRSPIVLVAFVDYQDAESRAAFVRVNQLADRLSGDVAIRYLPRSQYHPAALAVLCAGAFGHFQAMHRRLLNSEIGQSQRNWTQLARSIGIADDVAFDACLASDVIEQRLQRDRRFAERLQIERAPAFVGPGGVVTGVPELSDLEAIIAR